jgi:hypothetical protein
MFACAFFPASACGVAVIVTLFGVGAWPGAVYVALSTIELPLALCVVIVLDCVVTVLKVPQDAPLQPVPESDQFNTVLGFDPATGVIVATIVVAVPAGTLEGAVSCSVKLLVMLIVTDACFEGSATLVAVTTALDAAGKICGAM